MTEYGYCQHCDSRRVELVMKGGGVLTCSNCGAVNTYKNKKAYKNNKN